MPRVLKGAKLVQHHHVPQVDVGGGWVDPQLHPQLARGGELLRQAALGQGLDGTFDQARRLPGRCGIRHGANARLTRRRCGTCILRAVLG